jgi:electron transfer flavoprotein beta subunit
MNILVLIKKVPDPNLPQQFLSVSADGRAIELHSASQYTINQYDLNAVEAAIALKEAAGGSVTVMTADDSGADSFVRRAVSMGADRAVRVEAGAAVKRDPLAMAEAIATAIRTIGIPDLILAGRQASDTDAGFIPHAVAVKLGLPSLSPVVSLSAAGAGVLVAGKLTDTSIDDFEISLPAVLCVSNEVNKPRMPSLKGVMQSKKVAIEVIAAAPEAASADIRYEPKGSGRQAQTVTFNTCSDEEKAAALLAALGM